MTQLPPLPDIKSPSVMLHEIGQALEDAREHLAVIEAEIRRLANEGIFAAVPRMSWEKRKGKEYLYLWFPRVSDAAAGYGWTGPGGRQKVYVGRDPKNVARVRDMVERTRRVNDLVLTKERLARWLTVQEINVWRLHRVIDDFPRGDVDPLSLEFSEVVKWRIR